MKILKDSLEVEIDTWDDPGDYPSGAGAGPLPSYSYVAGVNGSLVVEIPKEELLEEGDFSNVEYDLSGITVSKWTILKHEFNAEIQVHTFTLEVDEFDSSAYSDDSWMDIEYEPELDEPETWD